MLFSPSSKQIERAERFMVKSAAHTSAVFVRAGADDVPRTEAEERLPKSMCKDIIAKCSKENNWPSSGWAYDGRKSIFAPSEIFPRKKTTVVVDLPGGRGDRKFEV